MIDLVCPGCRTRTPERLDVRTLSRRADGNDGILACDCGRTYAQIDGVPIVVTSPDVVTLLPRPATDVTAWLAEHSTDDAPFARMLEHLSIYCDAHWGDRASPPPDGPGAVAPRALIEKIAERATSRVARAVELGCSVGRFTAELAAGADDVVGLDLHHAALRYARAALAGESFDYLRRMIGRHYRAVRVEPSTNSGAGLRARPNNVTFVCGDALDPPLIAGMFGRVVALNLLDSVSNPRQLLSVVDALCAPGGELILASPYSWQSSVMPDAHRFGGDEPAETLRAILTEGVGLGARYAIEDEADLPWTLRRDARSAATYCIHYVRARQL